MPASCGSADALCLRTRHGGDWSESATADRRCHVFDFDTVVSVVIVIGVILVVVYMVFYDE